VPRFASATLGCCQACRRFLPPRSKQSRPDYRYVKLTLVKLAYVKCAWLDFVRFALFAVSALGLTTNGEIQDVERATLKICGVDQLDYPVYFPVVLVA